MGLLSLTEAKLMEAGERGQYLKECRVQDKPLSQGSLESSSPGPKMSDSL